MKFQYYVSLLSALFLAVPSHAEVDLALPGSPKGELHIELLQSRMFGRSMERQLRLVKERFPELKIAATAAEAAWKSSPFGVGCNAIEEDIILKAGDTGRRALKEMDEKSWVELDKLVTLSTLEQAEEFLNLVAKRAKGEIEVPMVRGNLLWQYKPFQEKPHEEFTRGYTQAIKHPVRAGKEVHFVIPMSWKTEKSAKDHLLTFRNCYGHGNILMNVGVAPTRAGGQPIPAREVFDACNEASLRAEYEQKGIKLTSFMKTKLNSLPAFFLTKEEPYEQLGLHALFVVQSVQVFSGDHMISFDLVTMGPVDNTLGQERIKKNEELFKWIAGSLQLTP